MNVKINYDKLVSARQKAKLTQTQVGVKIGCKRSALCKKEKGLAPLTFVEACIMSRMYGIDINELFIVEEA